MVFQKIWIILDDGRGHGLFVLDFEKPRPFSARMIQLNGNFSSAILNSGGQSFESRYTIIRGKGVLEG